MDSSNYENRKSDEPIAATKIDSGTDVNFGELTRKLFDHLESQNVELNYRHQVEDLNRLSNGTWDVKVKDVDSGSVELVNAKFVFIGAGGGSLHLLQKSGIPEGKGVGGFPVSGLFMVCNNPEVVKQHHAKVYGKAPVGAPPMSVPHLDTRFIDGKRTLLFGPFAGFSPKFLKEGSNLDLFTSVRPSNVVNMLGAGVKEMKLTKYLIQQVMQSKEKRMEALREFIPNAKRKTGRSLSLVSAFRSLKRRTQVVRVHFSSVQKWSTRLTVPLLHYLVHHQGPQQL